MSLKTVTAGIAVAIIALCLSLNVLAKNNPQDDYSNPLSQKNLNIIVSQGIALINNGDQSLARNDAINDALKKAVAQATGMLISSETVAQDYALLNNNIYTHASEYVQDYKVMDEKLDNNVYNITLQVSVNIKQLKKKLDSLNLVSSSKEEPIAAVIILEQNVGEERLESAIFYAPLSPFNNYIISGVHLLNEVGSMSIAENEMVKKLLANGVDVVDEEVLMKKIKLSTGYKFQSLDNTSVKEIGNLANVDIVIYGEAISKLYGKILGSEMKSAQADISLRAVNVKNGYILATGEQHAASVHIDPLTAGNEAIKKATDELADSFIPTMLLHLRQSISNIHNIKVVVIGIHSADELNLLKDQFLATDGVENVYDNSIGNDEVTLGIKYHGNSQYLINNLFTNKNVVSVYNITATTNDNTVTLTKKYSVLK